MTLKYLALTGLIFMQFSIARGQNTDLVNVSTDARTGFPRYAEFANESGLNESDFLEWLRSEYHLQSGVQFQLLRSDADELGFIHSRYVQYFNGIEVLHSMLILHSKNGHVESFNGEYFNQFEEKTSGLEIATARNIVLSSYGTQVIGKWQVAEDEQFIKTITKNPNATWYPKIAKECYAYPENYDGKQPLSYAYSFEIALAQPHLHQQVLLSINNHKIFRTIPLEVHTDSAGQAVTHYEGTKRITADFVSANSFRLRESGKRKIETYKSSTGTDYTDADNVWNNGADKIAGDVHYGAEMVSDLMKNWFNKNSYDDNGGALVSVNTGGSGNAFWNLSGNYATFLVGTSGSVGPCASLDVVGHEFGHGIADEIAGLLYSGEGCALHESFADINGHNTEWINDSTTANWFLGEKVWSSSSGIRYMADPFRFSNPKAYGGQYFPQGCHGSGGVQNYWYYIQVAGDTDRNEFNYNFSLPGLGHTKANAIIYRSIFYYLIPSSKFSDQYIGTLKAAKDLYGSCSFELEHTYKAWKAVNVEDTSVKTVDLSHGIKAPNLICNGAPVSATLNSFGDISRKVYWEINKTDTSTKRSFSYQFGKTGSYKVILTTTTCNQAFVDSMYITVNHKPKPEFTLPFDSACASVKPVTFLNTTVNADSKIPLKYEWYVNPGALTDTSKNLKTSFNVATDYEIQLKAYYEGGCWTAIKKLITILDAPEPKFTVIRDVCENRPVRLRNLTDTFKKPTSFEWIFPDNSIVTGWEPKNKSLAVAGKYNMILKAIFPYGNCSDTSMQTITIMPNPIPEFSYKNNCKGIDMLVIGSGKYFAPKQWSQWHLGSYNPLNKDTFLFNTLDSQSRTIGYTIGDSVGCFASIYKTIILETLKASVSANTVCLGDSTQFTTSIQHSEPYSVNWVYGDGESSQINLSSHLYKSSGTYSYQLKIKSKTCEVNLSQKASVWATPNVDFSSINVCDGDTAFFKNETAGKDSTQFDWNFGDNKTSNLVNANHLYPSDITRTYNVHLSGKYPNGCSAAITKQITVFELPKCTFSVEYDENAGNNGFNFKPQFTGYSSYSWDFGDGNKSNAESPFHRFPSNGKYPVKLKATNSAGCGCELIIEVNALKSGVKPVHSSNFSVFPNPANDFFTIQHSLGNYEFSLLDLKGTVVLNKQVDDTHLTLSTHGLAPGIYWLQLTDKESTQRVKLMVQ